MVPATRSIICLDGGLALGRAGLAAEVLLGDDVGRVLGPGLGELDVALLEGGRRGVADHGVAALPLELVVGVGALGREPAFDGQALLGRPRCCLGSCPGHQMLSSRSLNSLSVSDE